MTRQPVPAERPIPARPAGQNREPGYPDCELASLRAEFPGHRISTESIVDRVRYVARRQQENVRPHTVITAELDELRAVLDAGREATADTVSG